MTNITLDLNNPVDFDKFRADARRAGVSESDINGIADAMSNALAHGFIQRLPDGRYQVTERGLEFVRICNGG